MIQPSYLSCLRLWKPWQGEVSNEIFAASYDVLQDNQVVIVKDKNSLAVDVRSSKTEVAKS